jgi:hypothetical protein
MPARPITARQRQARADLLEDVGGALAREILKMQALTAGEDPEKIAAVLSGPDAEYVLVAPRALVEPYLRSAIDGALGIVGRTP